MIERSSKLFEVLLPIRIYLLVVKINNNNNSSSYVSIKKSVSLSLKPLYFSLSLRIKDVTMLVKWNVRR